MIKTRFMWGNFFLESSSLCVRRMCGGCSIDITLWFLPTASSHNLKTKTKYVAFELLNIWGHLVGQNEMIFMWTFFCIIRASSEESAKHQICCDIQAKGTFEETYSVYFCLIFGRFPSRGEIAQDVPLSSCSALNSSSNLLPVLGISVCFVASFGLAEAE